MKKIEESNKAIDSLNETSKIKENLMKLFEKWEEDSLICVKTNIKKVLTKNAKKSVVIGVKPKKYIK